MRISVCMGIYNGIRYLEEQLDCIRKQTRKPDEVILCDDGSTDGTREFLRRYLKQHRDTSGWKLILNEKNKGYPGNFYYAMDLCSGEIVFPADQDDVWDLCKIERMCRIMEKEKEIRVLGCSFGLIDSEDKAIHTVMAPGTRKKSGVRKPVSLKNVFYKYEWPGMVLAYRNAWYRKHVADCCDDKSVLRKIPHDFLLCVRAAEEQGFYQMGEKLAFHRRHACNTGKEEHRFGRLLKKKRKLDEISDYRRMLDRLSEGKVMQTREGRSVLERKRLAMESRYEALVSGKVGAVLRSAWKWRGEVRIATVVCDVVIVGQ